MERTVVLFTILGTADCLRLELKISSISPDGRSRSLIKPCYCNLTRLPNSLLVAYEECKNQYLETGVRSKLWTRSISIPTTQINNCSSPDFDRSRNHLIDELDRWLNSCNLNNLYRDLTAKVNPDKYQKSPDLVSFAIQTDATDNELNFILQRLPWNNSDLLGREHYPNAEIVFATKSTSLDRVPHKLNAFVICGADESIDIEPDLQALRTHLPDNVKILPLFKGNPSTLIYKLSQYSMAEEGEQIHLLFFVGHSTSTDTPDIRIYINNTEYISPANSNFRTVLTALKNRGLILAFFNSCDGLGIAKELVDIGIPNLIVMKETIHDLTAQKFIGQFLKKWAESNTPIDIAFQRAKFELRFNPETPNGDFLPALFRKYDRPPLILPQSIQKRLISFVKENWKYLKRRPSVLYPSLILLATGIYIVSSILFYQLEPICDFAGRENNISCGEEILSVKPTQVKEKNFNLIKQGLDRLSAKQVINDLEKDWALNHDPETSIAIQNLTVAIESSQNPAAKIKNIAVVIPSGRNGKTPRYITDSILKGVAYAQQQYHDRNPKRDWSLRVLIADDSNNEKQAEEIAKKLVIRPDILGIIGHYSSQVTLPIIERKIYEDKVVLISPTATSHKLRDKSKFFFRVSSQSSVLAKGMVDNWVNPNRKIVLFYQNGEFSQSLTRMFKEKIQKKYSNLIVKEFELSTADIKRDIDLAMAQGANSIVLFPDAYTGDPNIRDKFEQVITHNRGRLPILANTSIYDIYDEESQNSLTQIRPQMYRDVAISIPWDNYNNRNNLVINKNTNRDRKELLDIPEWWLTTKKQPLSMLNQRTVMAYDAMSVLLSALKDADDRVKVQKIVADPRFYAMGISSRGMKNIRDAGSISFNGSDRKEEFYSLVTPNCTADECNGFKPWSNPVK
jgi:branched-chain amino acid transport system substrate-binding protein